MTNRFPKVLALLLAIGMTVLALPVSAQPQPKEFKKWPTGRSPQEIGKRGAERPVSTPHANFSRPG